MNTEPSLTEERQQQLQCYLDAALALQGFDLDAAQRAGVLQNLERLAAMAATFLDVPLAPANESAAMFHP